WNRAPPNRRRANQYSDNLCYNFLENHMVYTPIGTTTDLAARLVPRITREDDHIDFKEEPWATNDAGKRECARDVAQFANASGGTVVVGAVEGDHVLEALKNVSAPDEL